MNFRCPACKGTFPVEKGGKVYAHGVHAAESYATKNGHSDIAAAAKKLASAIQDKKNGVKRIPSSSLVKEDADQGIVGGVGTALPRGPGRLSGRGPGRRGYCLFFFVCNRRRHRSRRCSARWPR